MSRPITLTNEQINEIVEDFKRELTKTRYTESDIKMTRSIPKSTERAKVLFSPKAWLKQSILLDNCDKEVAWHGVAERVEGVEGNVYRITDILVYPQTVTASAVDMDTEQYAKWLQAHDEDERFEKLHMQGHSHVNMGVTPSSVDIAHQMDILQMIGDDSFYIFIIMNKRRERYIRVFDLGKNLIFEQADIDVMIFGMNEFFDELKTNVTERKISYRSWLDKNEQFSVQNEFFPPEKPITKLDPKERIELKSALPEEKKKGV